MARAIARTTLSLGDLLEVPIGIVAATGTDDVKFDTACPDGAPRIRQYVHPEQTRTLYEWPRDDDPGDAARSNDLHDPAEAFADLISNKVEVPAVVTEAIKGIRVGDHFRPVPPSELEYAAAATKLDSIQLLEFIDYRRVPTDRLTGSFWIQPDPGFDKPLATIMAAMRADGRAMLVKWSAGSRQRLGVIRVRKTSEGDALLLNGVVFAAEWRAPDARALAPGQVEVESRAVKAAREVIEAYAGNGDALDTAADNLPELLTKIVERVHDGVFDEPQRVLELAATCVEDGLPERATRLVSWAGEHWPRVAANSEEVEKLLTEGGEDVAEKLAALVA